MNCPKCNSPVREGAKFCTACGQKIAPAGTPPAASVPAAEPNRGNVPAPANVVAPEAAETSVAGQRIYWNILPGQIARVITEAEFESFGGVRGIIVPEGTTAYVRANGRSVAALSGGAYDFVGDPEAVGGNDGILKRGWRLVANLFRSPAAKEAAERDAEASAEYVRRQRLILENAKNGAAFSIVILLNKAFPLLVGARQASAEDYKNFAPMKIRTRRAEMDVGVNAYFKITDHEQFILHYLTDRSLFCTTHVLDEISDPVRVCVQEILRDCEPDENGRIPDDVRRALKTALCAEAERGFHGISIVRVAEITASNEDLARFAELSREMYLSEKELDYLKRTNDFKNRLADVTNAQAIQEARTAEELRKKLDEVNRDGLLREDEFEAFRKTLENARIVRDAKNDDERDAALDEIRKAGLVREAELERLKSRESSVLKMMQLKDGIDFERVRMQGEQELALAAIEGELAVAAKRDEYADARFYKELEKRKAEGDLDFELRNREDDADFARFMAMQNAAREHELARERLKGENAQKLSAEQILAMNGGDAATELARAQVARYSAEAERRASERAEQESLNRQKFMEAVTLQALGANAAARQPGVPAPHAVPLQPAPAAGTVFCGECGAKNPAGMRFCGACGARLG